MLFRKPSYVIGLQFEIIILVGCYNIYSETAPNQSGYKRRFLNDLYLGSSRAKNDLYLFSNKGDISIPDVIKTALENNILSFTAEQDKIGTEIKFCLKGVTTHEDS